MTIAAIAMAAMLATTGATYMALQTARAADTMHDINFDDEEQQA